MSELTPSEIEKIVQDFPLLQSLLRDYEERDFRREIENKRLKRRVVQLETEQSSAALSTASLFEKGKEAYRRGNFYMARDIFHANYLLVPDHANTQYYLGCTYLKLGQDSYAEDAFRRTIELDPKHSAHAYYNLGKLLIKSEDLDAGLSCMDQALTLDQNKKGPHYHKGDIFEQKGRYKDAIAEFQLALERDVLPDKTRKRIETLQALTLEE